MKKILVAVDGSESSDKAIEKAKEIGIAFSSRITILHVVEDLANPDAFYASYTSAHAKTAQRELKKQSGKLLSMYADRLKDYDGEVDTLTKSGKPGDTIKEVADEGSYDLVVMGNRGLGVFAGAMLGSVSNKVVNKSTMSVLIVK